MTNPTLMMKIDTFNKGMAALSSGECTVNVFGLDFFFQEEILFNDIYQCTLEFSLQGTTDQRLQMKVINSSCANVKKGSIYAVPTDDESMLRQNSTEVLRRIAGVHGSEEAVRTIMLNRARRFSYTYCCADTPASREYFGKVPIGA